MASRFAEVNKDKIQMFCWLRMQQKVHGANDTDQILIRQNTE